MSSTQHPPAEVATILLGSVPLFYGILIRQ